jgi:FkbM family methyltransferase
MGANLGFHATHAALLGHPVVAFEMNPVTASVLRANAGLNDVADRLQVVEAGVSDAAANMSFYVLPNSPSTASLSRGFGKEMNANRAPVKIVRADSVLKGAPGQLFVLSWVREVVGFRLNLISLFLLNLTLECTKYRVFGFWCA